MSTAISPVLSHFHLLHCVVQTSAGVCAQCEKSLFGLKPLDLFDRRCCSSPCVVLLRRKLAVQAAEKRFAAPS